MIVKSGFPAVADQETRLFVLGSLPGERSLEQRQYYAHSTNQFWKLIGGVIGVDLDALDYGARLAVLRNHGIGLWDVVEAARRQGSGDHAIRDARHNDLGGLKRDFPKLEAIAFNGSLAARDGTRLLAGIEAVKLIALPSSSAAHARMTLDQKARAWSVLREYVQR